MAETGLPGSPKTSAPCWATPNQVGLPGFSATRQKTRSTPSEANASLTWSWPPTETPPQTTTSSASSMRSIAALGELGIVPHRLRCHQLRPRAQGERRDRVGVGVPNATGLPRRTGFEQLVARRQHRQTRAPDAADRRSPDRREHTELRRTDASATSQHRGPRLDVVTGVPHVGARLHLGLDLDTPVANARVLDPYDRVGSIRDHGAGRDPDRLPSVQRRQCGATRPGLIPDRENHRAARRGAPRVLRPHREAVHRGVVEAGNRVGALHVDGENPSERLAQRDRLRAQRADPLEDETPGVAEGDRLVRRRCRQGALTRLPASRRSP